MKNWDYATHSHIVKTLGGPQKYISTIRTHERQLTTAAVKRKNISDEEAQQAEKELIEFFEEPDREEYMSEESPC